MSFFDHRLRYELTRKMLLHNRLTRRQIAEAFGLSMPAVTRHVRWLEDNDLVTLKRVRMPNVKRPVETLHLQGTRATGLTALLHADHIDCEIIAANGQPLKQIQQPLAERTQRGVADALRLAVREARTFGQQISQALDTVAIGIHGFMEPTNGMIFAIRGFPDWEPCLLGQVIDEMHGLAVVPTTSVACKLFGLSTRLREDDRIGFIEKSDGMLAIASLRAGSLELGRFGTASSAVHVRVSDSPRRCYCGKNGCLDEHLRVGDATDQMLLTALPHILKTLQVTTLGLDLEGVGDAAAEICRANGVPTIHLCPSDDELARQGLRIVCARTILQRLVDRTRPIVRREIVNPSAFRSESLDASRPHVNKSNTRKGKVYSTVWEES